MFYVNVFLYGFLFKLLSYDFLFSTACVFLCSQ